MAVGREIEAATGLRLFHNHVAIEPVLPFFTFGTEPFVRLVDGFRNRMFEEVAQSDLPGMIFTFVWDLNSQSDTDFIERACSVFTQRGHNVAFVCTLGGAEASDAPEAEVRELLPRSPGPAELERNKRRRKLLTEFRTREAERREVDPQVVLPGHCLSDMVDLPLLSKEAMATIHGFGACRVERYGDDLVAELTRAW